MPGPHRFVSPVLSSWATTADFSFRKGPRSESFSRSRSGPGELAVLDENRQVDDGMVRRIAEDGFAVLATLGS
ncbi:hypothetical protein [Krasilnikovia cinnamomea]|uniref:hypothetical protein n=1 Tax=Krasilnikovia cinnamomea TaxID=349313 RepID=UPI001F5E3EE9|nr:hypothetical protein [Krasilnikovia cinnamomea]